MDDLFSWPGWSWAGWNAVGAVGGLAGLLSLMMTLLRRRPRVRWTFVRIEARYVDLARPETINLVFRNTGDAVAHDVHTLDTLGTAERPVEQPMTGRTMRAPGEEIRVMAFARVIEGITAGRKYNAGEDSVFDLSGEVRVLWREGHSARLRSWRMTPTRDVQGSVPLVGVPEK